MSIHIRSLRRFIRNNKSTFDFENQTLFCLSKLIANPLPEKQHQTLEAFIEVLETMKSDINGQMALFCFDLPAWLKGWQLRR